MFRTLGIPILSFDRYSGVAEGVLADHFRNIGMSTFDFLQLGFHHPHLVRVLEQALGTGIAADDTLLALGERHLAPRPALRTGQHHVDEGAPAAHRAPLAYGVLVGGALVLERLDGFVAAEARRLALAPPIPCAQ